MGCGDKMGDSRAEGFAMMDWKADISAIAQSWMMVLGNFNPTTDKQNRTVKGYMYDDDGVSKTYLDAGELRGLAIACNEVADWLDRRANSAKEIMVKNEPIT